MIESQTIAQNKRRTLLVVILTSTMMIAEIIAGYFTGSMALLADGWHMASHAGALLVSFLVYELTQSKRLQHSFNFGTGKLLPLGGYTTAIGLAIVSIEMAYESITRLFHPVSVGFHEAIAVATLGLAVNLVSVLILRGKHEHGEHSHAHDEHHDHDHTHDHHDHNYASAVAHVLADAVTSLAAIAALALGAFFHLNWPDPLVGLLGSFVILHWAYTLCKNAAWELLDGNDKTIDAVKLTHFIEATGAKVLDLHLWKIGPSQIAGQLVIESNEHRGTHFYRSLIDSSYRFSHLVIEERLK